LVVQLSYFISFGNGGSDGGMGLSTANWIEYGQYLSWPILRRRHRIRLYKLMYAKIKFPPRDKCSDPDTNSVGSE
jgi:hypothetical protein